MFLGIEKKSREIENRSRGIARSMRNKKAFIVGINYVDIKNVPVLTGCINDALMIKRMLIRHYGYEAKNILLLTDVTKVLPTRKNILAGFNWLLTPDSEDMFIKNPNNYQNINGMRKITNGNIYFHYSGHGFQKNILTGLEKDNKTELIAPIDYIINGGIDDDEINSELIQKVPPNVELNMTMDCCHGGTITNLPIYYSDNKRELVSDPTINRNGISNLTICFSGSKDDQNGFDMMALKDDNNISLFESNNMNKNVPMGSMTYAFLKTLKENNYNISYIDLYYGIMGKLKKQTPVLSSSEFFNVNMIYNP